MREHAKSSALFLGPLLVSALLFGLFLAYGPLGVFHAHFPPVENVFIQRVEFAPETVTLRVLNDGPQEVTVAQAAINDVFWRFTMEPADQTLRPLQHGVIRFSYPWVQSEPLRFKLLASDGVAFEKEVPVAFPTPRVDGAYVRVFVLLGLYVGVIPVLLGLLWLPFLRRMGKRTYAFLLAATVGILLFLGFDALAETLDLLGEVPQAFNGVGLVVIGVITALLALGLTRGLSSGAEGGRPRSLVWSYLIAAGIGLHNLGEGLAIGSAYAVGEIALGGALVAGFMLHNLTEGVAIVAPLGKEETPRSLWRHVTTMGLIAGVPTVLGSLLGGFAYSPSLALLFLAVGVGAMFDVAFVILFHLCGGAWNRLYKPEHALGLLAGMCAMYGTGVLVGAL